jgi:hypothetical protein
VRARKHLRAARIDSNDPLYVSAMLRTHRTAPQRGRLPGFRAGEQPARGIRRRGKGEACVENL